MDKSENKHGFMDLIKDGLGYVSQVISTIISPPLVESAEIILKNMEERLLRIEKRILKKMYSLFIIGLGGVFLILALFFFLIEYVGWSKYLAFFSIGITIFVIGLLLKLRESDL